MILSENRPPLFLIMLAGPDAAHRWPTQHIMPSTESGCNWLPNMLPRERDCAMKSATRPPERNHDPQPRPHSYDPCRQPAAQLLVQREAGESYDKALFDAEMEKAVRHVVAKQKEAGIDIGNDGEQQRVGFQTYVPQRMSGFGGESKRRRGREFEEFPELVSYLTRRFPNVSRQQNAPHRRAKFIMAIHRPSSARSRCTGALPAKASRLPSRS
jgi:hypothetical protein